MMRCARCLQHVSTGPTAACPSCAWRSVRREAESEIAQEEMQPDASAWKAFYAEIQGEDDQLRRLRLFALLLDENPGTVARRAAGGQALGDENAFRTELLRLAEQLLARIDEF